MGHALPVSYCRAPSVGIYGSVIYWSKRSAPGRDGIPFGCWYNAGQFAWRTLQLVVGELWRGVLPPAEFNESIGVFLPKGDAPEDAFIVARTPEQTRLLI